MYLLYLVCEIKSQFCISSLAIPNSFELFYSRQITIVASEEMQNCLFFFFFFLNWVEERWRGGNIKYLYEKKYF